MDAKTHDVPSTTLTTIPLGLDDADLMQIAVRRTTSFQHVDKKTGAVTLRYNYEIIMDGMPSLPAVGGPTVSRAQLRVWRAADGKAHLYIALI